MIEVRIYGRAECPHCKAFYREILRLMSKAGLSRVPVIFQEIYHYSSPPLPDKVIVVDPVSGKVLGMAPAELFRETYPIIIIELYLAANTSVRLAIVPSTIPRDVVMRLSQEGVTIYEAIARRVVDLVYRFRMALA